MTFWEKLVTTKDKVEYLLTHHPHLRDSDHKLMANIWYNEKKVRRANYDAGIVYSADDFLFDFSKGHYTNAETIRRNRAELQRKNVHLQGEVYKERIEQGLEVQEKIHDL